MEILKRRVEGVVSLNDKVEDLDASEWSVEGWISSDWRVEGVDSSEFWVQCLEVDAFRSSDRREEGWEGPLLLRAWLRPPLFGFIALREGRVART